MKNIDWKNLFERAIWTFVEAFIVALPTTLSIEMSWKSVLTGILLPAAAAGISAVKTLIMETFFKKDTETEVVPEVIPEPTPETDETPIAFKKVYLSPSGQMTNTYAKPYDYTNEGEQCMKIAKACEEALIARGFSVMNGAGKDYNVRYAEAKEFMPDLYLPIHTNGFDGVVSGTRMFVYADGDEGHRICRFIFKYLDDCCPGKSSNIKVTGEKYEEMRIMHKYGINNCYAECDFHDVPSVAEFIVGHTTEIGESIARGICEAFGVDW